MELWDQLSKFQFPTKSAVKDAFSVLGNFKNEFSQYVVRPLNAFGVGGFVFDVEGETQHKLKAEITDHYTENNSFIQDHIAINPTRITLKSAVGELVYREENDGNSFLQNLTRKLTILNDLIPDFSEATKQFKNTFEKGVSIEDIKNSDLFTQTSALNIWRLVKNLTPPITRQEQAYMYFKALMQQKILVSVQTPFSFMTNMAIESIVAVQGEDSKYISTFTITLKEIRFAEIRTEQADIQQPSDTSGQEAKLQNTPTNYAGRNLIQREVQLDQGKSEGLPILDNIDAPDYVDDYYIELLPNDNVDTNLLDNL
jgi:hypothetical protein